MNQDNRVIIFDTTLRDGEQSPGASMNKAEKLRIATQLEQLGVDVIEAGFPASSQGDFDAVRSIAENLKKSQTAALCRASKSDIDRGWEAIRNAAAPRIHTFIATSDLHMEYKLKMDRNQVLEKAVEAVRHAASYTDNVEFSAEDGSRSDPDFLCRVFEAVIDAGATTVNLPDTVGYAVPAEFSELVTYVTRNTPNMAKAVLSVHCHNDLGLATANTLAAVESGARQVEVTINGIGERAGNTSLEEVVMSLNTRPNFFPHTCGIDTTKIYPTSRLVSMVTGIMVQPNRPVIGANAFAHEAGIHQDGVLKNPMTYEIMKPETVGVKKNNLVLGKHSGKHAFKNHIGEMGYSLSEDEIDSLFEKFKQLSDRKKDIQNEDIEALINESVLRSNEIFRLEYIHVACGNTVFPTASLQLSINDRQVKGAKDGNGPIDAVYNVIADITGTKSELLRFSISALTEGTDAQGEVTVRLMEEGLVALGKGADPDIITASALAYINGLNRLEYLKENPSIKPDSL
ncbi:MAG: 2-isopropylmalate synthase [Desulfarculaceae bacterium]|nr:2-isopropylmalate synthase [Desulfarculaceae bacterium]